MCCRSTPQRLDHLPVGEQTHSCLMHAHASMLYTFIAHVMQCIWSWMYTHCCIMDANMEGVKGAMTWFTRAETKILNSWLILQ